MRHVEAGSRKNRALIVDDRRIVARAAKLELDRNARLAKRVAERRKDRCAGAEGQRVLHAARGPMLFEVAAGKKLPQTLRDLR